MSRGSAIALLCATAVLGSAPVAVAQDSLAPPGAAKHWLPNERWVNLLWLPYDEDRLYRLLRHDRGDVFRWVRTERTLADLGATRGWTPDRLADALVAPRRSHLTPQQLAAVRERAERTLTQGHLAQHLLFHALHQTAVPRRARRIFGTPDDETFGRLRRAELSPLQIGELHGRTRVQMTRGVIRTLQRAVRRGVSEGTLPPRQAKVMLDRQLRAVPRWLGQSRYNGPSGGRNRELPWGDFARHPSISRDGSTVVWDAYRATVSDAERHGEIHVRGADLRTGRRFAVSPQSTDPHRPVSAYNGVISADGEQVAFESSASTYPLAKRVGQMTVTVRDLRKGRSSRVSHARRRPGAPSRTAFNPSLSEDGRVVVFEATDAGVAGAPSRNGLWVVDRRTGRERLIADDSIGAAYLPEVSGNGRSVVYTSARRRELGVTHVFRTDLRTGRTVRVAIADGRDGAVADSDSYDPAVAHDGRTVAFVSRAANLGAPGGRPAVFVRDVEQGRTEWVSRGVPDHDAGSPAISATGRFVAFVSMAGRPDGTPESLRSRLWVFDRRTGRTTLASRADGPDGAAADGYTSEPAISADGTRVTFTSTAGNLDDAKPANLPGVFVRDLATGRTSLLSTHARRRDAGTPLLVPALVVVVVLAGAGGALGVRRRRRTGPSSTKARPRAASVTGP